MPPIASKQSKDSKSFFYLILFTLLFISSTSIFLVYHGHSINELPSFISTSSSFTNNLIHQPKPTSYSPSKVNYSSIKKFYTPIEITILSPNDVKLTLCSLDFESYSQNPHEYSMFRFFTNKSKCDKQNLKVVSLNKYLKDIEEEVLAEKKEYLLENNLSLDLLSENEDVDEIPNGRLRFTPPKLFVFHESRVGSTLIANLLASDQHSMVFSESSPILTALLYCKHCNHEEKIQLFRNIIKVMSLSRYHKNFFVKFQSIGSTGMALALEAFPEIAWVYAYRNPVQTIMSHLDPLKGSTGAPCLRSKSNPSDRILDNFKANGLDRSAPNEAWCAAHLEMLSSHALSAYETYSMNELTKKQRGVLINYDSLPGVIPRVIFPLADININIDWLNKMNSESQEYSKSGAKEKPKFTSDSEDKENRSTDKINKYSQLLLEPTFNKMNEITSNSILHFINYYKNKEDQLLFNDIKITEYQNYDLIKNIPNSNSLINRTKRAMKNKVQSNDPLEIPHSPLLIENYFSASSPFANDHDSKRFEAIDCTLPPTEDYPKAYPFFDVIDNWNPDDVKIPQFHYDSICHFNFQDEFQLNQAKLYQKMEKPFVLYNIPELDEISSKWSTFDYLIKKVGNTKFRTESSHTNHFMYWKYPNNKFLRSKENKNWEEPTTIVKRTLPQWLDTAIKGQSIENEKQREHEYFRLNSDPDNPWIYDDLPFFNPDNKFSSEPFPFLVNPSQQRGIHCRLGMRSVIAEAHFDASRNMVVELAGLRRWILAHPKMCGPLDLYPSGHPSARHSKGDWSKPETLDKNIYGHGLINEVILRPGDALFVPTDWIHYIVSLNVNIQCNTRSGLDRKYRKDLATCGFIL